MRKILDYFEEILCATCLSIMTALTFVNVVARYVFSASFSFSEEITTYLFVLLSLLGAAIATKRGAHLGFSLLTELVSPGLRKAMHIIGLLFAVGFCVTLFYHGLLMTSNQFVRNQVTAGMQWPEWIFGAFVPLGSIFLTIRFSELLVKEIRPKGGK